MHDECFFSKTDRIKSRLYRIAYGYFGNEGATVDAVDEAIFKAYRAKNSLRQPEFFDAWMTRILINECHRLLRRHRRERPVEVLPDNGVEIYDNLPQIMRRDCLMSGPNCPSARTGAWHKSSASNTRRAASYIWNAVMRRLRR